MKISDALTYATLNGCKVSDIHIMRYSRLKSFSVTRGDNVLYVNHTAKGSRSWKVNGILDNHAGSIVTAVNILKTMD